MREVWEKEAKDFTDWLFENIDLLGEELDMELTPDEKEKKAGSFSADITATDAAGQTVIIENQLEKTDHTHLGQIITYISNLEAKTAIWISSEPRPEHKTAIEWLNETGGGVNFYLIKIEAYRIGGSPTAAKFTIETGPSEKTGYVSSARKEKVEKEREKYFRDFWKTLLERARLQTKLHANISPSGQIYIATSSGVRGLGFRYTIRGGNGQVGLYIDRGDGSDEENAKIFDALHTKREEIEAAFGSTLEWQRADSHRYCRIAKSIGYADFSDKDTWPALQDEMIKAMILFHKVLNKHIQGWK